MSLTLDLPGGWRAVRVSDQDDARFRVDDLFPEAGPHGLRHLEGVPDWAWAVQDGVDWMRMDFAAWVVWTDRHLVVIDTCLGNHKHRPRRPAWDRREADFCGRLARAGVDIEAVDTVLCTHLHADHVGWNTTWRDGRWVPTFPNARYCLGRVEVAWMADREAAEPGAADGSFADSVQPLLDAGLVNLVEDGWELQPGFRVGLAPGHTPGNLVVELRDPRWSPDSAPHTVFCGDVVHHPLQLARPELSTRVCSDPGLARTTRQVLLAEWEATGASVYPAHFRGPGGGRIEVDGTDGPAYRLVP